MNWQPHLLPIFFSVFFMYQPSVSKHTAAYVAKQEIMFYNEIICIGLFFCSCWYLTKQSGISHFKFLVMYVTYQ